MENILNTVSGASGIPGWVLQAFPTRTLKVEWAERAARG
jgi:hypothetical protein